MPATGRAFSLAPLLWGLRWLLEPSDILFCACIMDSLFASKPVGPGFEPCLGQSAKLAGAPKPLCVSCHIGLTY